MTYRYDFAQLLNRILEELGLETEYKPEDVVRILRMDSNDVEQDIKLTAKQRLDEK